MFLYISVFPILIQKYDNNKKLVNEFQQNLIT